VLGKEPNFPRRVRPGWLASSRDTIGILWQTNVWVRRRRLGLHARTAQCRHSSTVGGKADEFGFATFDYTVAWLLFRLAGYTSNAEGDPKVAGRKRYLQVALAFR
jgi:hypothetical protein